MNLKGANFNYKDRNGENDLNAEGNIFVDFDEGTVSISVLQGDMDGDGYTAYVPNHRVAILELIDALTKVLDITQDWPQGYDGFSYNQACAYSTGDVREGTINEGEQDGVIKWFG